ncbi:tRNA (guanosine(37)-N1)-methyltransferase TrmD [Paenibacillus melissococcoides]|uniref:tRNA (guanine-N(1)-)-methyltransferase n=1 Tax=Paenibacillus melissococcoides TaxID=2912268 RepID=A0ABN8TY92_9BACL|nr:MULTISPECIES: tRNA (guanosine(37)-N1)-methyltransferase TrmD [Paenibacillus]MEB9896718.1 tRNA (guanosine(37)-N1)-methyltransferase TrmD [Bacillus cereus]CAH8243739.1 tRNA (guanosine(37)-N1)-methyltransferase TrmD [Paenibacillus melissococcoides]CAH8704740.1 tRNA (guanosine(37)-N1)-methyltransferase TrmD [Paenibacillus melissococcoides]CAH8707511.1 tRNA (guanosine(37)-N1)-methyltransferase TrmD [Paenibacillus melissococcoides]GIO82092.1 tRNA (guanine-N(1)-)-methyltransferase [Paenibacillus d
MRIDVLTIFPEMCEGVFRSSILGKAQEKGLVTLHAVNFRDYSGNKHQTVDDYPYGGGGGMVLKPEPIFAAVEAVIAQAEQARLPKEGEAPEADDSHVPNVRSDSDGPNGPNRPERKRPRVILMCPQGEPFTQAKAEELAQESHLILICGHYEGYDERIREHLVTDELSIGDYVLTGGELPAMVVTDSVVRLLPGVLGNESSAVTDSFSTGLLEYPHYTRPADFRGWTVPDVLLSGHHANVEQWRKEQSLRRTVERRPDLLESIELGEADQKLLERIIAERQANEANQE